MSYSEENGEVVLRMNWMDYETLLTVFAMATTMSLKGPSGNTILGPDRIIPMVDRLNSGNPNYTPYQVESDVRKP
jgi:hypothetical protein